MVDRGPEAKAVSLAAKEVDSVRAEVSAKEKADPAQVEALRAGAVLAKNHPANSGNNYQAKSITH